MHLCRSDLHLDALTEGTEKQGMQGLVAVGFWDRDVILELARHGLIRVVNHTQNTVTGVDRTDDDSDSEDIPHLRHRYPP